MNQPVLKLTDDTQTLSIDLTNVTLPNELLVQYEDGTTEMFDLNLVSGELVATPKG